MVRLYSEFPKVASMMVMASIDVALWDHYPTFLVDYIYLNTNLDTMPQMFLKEEVKRFLYLR